MSLILPENYDPRLDVRGTQEAIKYIRDTFQKEFGREMNLERISAPLFVEKSSGLNDDLTWWCIPLPSGRGWRFMNMDSNPARACIRI